MESVNSCPYCNSSNREIIRRQTHEDRFLSLINSDLNKTERFWHRCKQCGFVYRSPRTTRAEEDILYAKLRSFDFLKVTPQQYFDRLTLSSNESECYKRVMFIKEYSNVIDSVLDVGCGGGILLYFIKQCFPEAELTGIEPNKEFAEMVEKNLGIDVVNDVYKAGLISKRFDLILCTDVIEHVSDIYSFWNTIEHNIKVNGLLFIEVPSIENFNNVSLEHDVFGSQHLYFYGVSHLKEISMKYGYNIIQNYTYDTDRGEVVKKDVLLLLKKNI